MYQVQVLRDSQWHNAGAYVRETHAVQSACELRAETTLAKAVRVLDPVGRLIFPRCGLRSSSLVGSDPRLVSSEG